MRTVKCVHHADIRSWVSGTINNGSKGKENNYQNS